MVIKHGDLCRFVCRKKQATSLTAEKYPLLVSSVYGTIFPPEGARPCGPDLGSVG